MPEYSQIQTYVRCNENNLEEHLKKFKLLLKDIGFSDNYMHESFRDLRWEEEDIGFVYTLGDFDTVRINYNFISLNLRPLTLGWTPRISDKIKENWLELELLFETEEIISDYRTGKLKDGAKEIIIDYMIMFSKYFDETGIYFTDEATDGMPWYALIGDGDKPWAFDIAIISQAVESFYSDIPDNFKKQMIGDKCIHIRNGY